MVVSQQKYLVKAWWL